MGKAKKRLLHKSNSMLYMTREGALNKVFNLVNNSENFDKKEVLNTITLFGLSGEELSEAGMPYEDLKALEAIVEV